MPNWLGPDYDFGVFLGKTVAEVPVRNGLLTVEETCFGEKECAGTDGCDATRPPCDFREPGDEVGIVTAAFCAGTSGDDKGVDGTMDVGDRSCVGEHDATIGLKSSFKAGIYKLNLVIRRIGKDL
jgi:hypothetical protein